MLNVKQQILIKQLPKGQSKKQKLTTAWKNSLCLSSAVQHPCLVYSCSDAVFLPYIFYSLLLRDKNFFFDRYSN
jgi:hypothetical protein